MNFAGFVKENTSITGKDTLGEAANTAETTHAVPQTHLKS